MRAQSCSSEAREIQREVESEPKNGCNCIRVSRMLFHMSAALVKFFGKSSGACVKLAPHPTIGVKTKAAEPSVIARPAIDLTLGAEAFTYGPTTVGARTSARAAAEPYAKEEPADDVSEALQPLGCTIHIKYCRDGEP